MEKKPMGRPAMDCVAINDKTFQRKKPETIKKAQTKKCTSRESHPVKPCMMNKEKKCVPKVSTAKCNDARPKPLSMFKGKKEQKIDLVKRCTALGTKIGKKCTVPNKKKLVCHDADMSNKKAKAMKKQTNW